MLGRALLQGKDWTDRVLTEPQSASNAALGRALGHPLWATLISLTVSLLVLVPVLLAMRVPSPFFGQALQMPTWIWAGGILGVVYLSASLMLAPRLGATGLIVCVMAGQMIAALIIDQFGLMGLAARPINLGRSAGVMLIVAGMLLVIFTSSPIEHRAHQGPLATSPPQ
ncbi:DMT family transporter [Zobellella maritima]|uniref:DMT family transporter n=1 Tax=Zobellella maritima TaxID=2059725 RepID=UPI000E301E14|nr:DMT family transporter [Zobellella maritima]